jgi:hypothetical protein
MLRKRMNSAAVLFLIMQSGSFVPIKTRTALSQQLVVIQLASTMTP